VTRTLSIATLTLLLAACGGGGGATSGGLTPDSTLEQGASTTNVLVDPTTEADLADLCAKKQAKALRKCTGTAYTVVEIPTDSSVKKFLADLDDEPTVEDAVPDVGLDVPEGGGSTIPAFVEEDPSAVQAQVALDRIGATVAHARGYRGDGVLVAVIDTGVDASHPLLAGRVVEGWDLVDEDADPDDVGNGLDDDRDGRVDEGVGHGTFVASLILAVAPNARILPIRALDSDSTGTASTVARGIAMAVARGARVVNFSGGLRAEIRMIEQIVRHANDQGVAVIAAAGNRAGAVDYPAALDGVVGVTSVNHLDVKSTFASFGTSIDFCAPGEDLLGINPRSPSFVARWSGTSFATALVTGGYAVLQAIDDDGAPEDILARLESSARSVSFANWALRTQLGAGRIDLDRATLFAAAD
jgi:subtilisin family serine protease